MLFSFNTCKTIWIDAGSINQSLNQSSPETAEPLCSMSLSEMCLMRKDYTMDKNLCLCLQCRSLHCKIRIKYWLSLTFAAQSAIHRNMRHHKSYWLILIHFQFVRCECPCCLSQLPLCTVSSCTSWLNLQVRPVSLWPTRLLWRTCFLLITELSGGPPLHWAPALWASREQHEAVWQDADAPCPWRHHRAPERPVHQLPTQWRHSWERQRGQGSDQ